MAESAGVPPYRLKQFKYNSHYWILKFIEEARRPLRILDVGTADGYLGAVLKERGHHVVGVESDDGLARRAKCHYDAFHEADIEAFELPYRDEFDVILFADVLEHLRSPEKVLAHAMPALNPEGQFLISVPNVANFMIRGGLLFGRFEYVDRGILDRAHLRFYTLASLESLLRAASCRLIQVTPTPVPVQLVLPSTDRAIFFPFHELHFLAVRLWKTLLAYQFVVRAVPERR